VKKIMRFARKKIMRFARKKPQMTDLEIKYVESLATNFEKIIEFGSGLSTLKWSKTLNLQLAISLNINIMNNNSIFFC
jgi:hypothetical protein